MNLLPATGEFILGNEQSMACRLCECDTVIAPFYGRRGNVGIDLGFIEPSGKTVVEVEVMAVTRSVGPASNEQAMSATYVQQSGPLARTFNNGQGIRIVAVVVDFRWLRPLLDDSIGGITHRQRIKKQERNKKQKSVAERRNEPL